MLDWGTDLRNMKKKDNTLKFLLCTRFNGRLKTRVVPTVMGALETQISRIFKTATLHFECIAVTENCFFINCPFDTKSEDLRALVV